MVRDFGGTRGVVVDWRHQKLETHDMRPLEFTSITVPLHIKAPFHTSDFWDLKATQHIPRSNCRP